MSASLLADTELAPVVPPGQARRRLGRRHGGDPERQKAMLERLTQIRYGLLDRDRLDAGDTLLDVGCGDGLIGFGALDRVGPTDWVIFLTSSEPAGPLPAAGIGDGCRRAL